MKQKIKSLVHIRASIIIILHMIDSSAINILEIAAKLVEITLSMKSSARFDVRHFTVNVKEIDMRKPSPIFLLKHVEPLSLDEAIGFSTSLDDSPDQLL